jgi:hypothetical protein
MCDRGCLVRLCMGPYLRLGFRAKAAHPLNISHQSVNVNQQGWSWNLLNGQSNQILETHL